MLTIFELLIYRDRIILAQVPRHGNGGDLAITIAEKSLLKDVYPKKKMIEIPSEICTDAFVRLNDTLKLKRLIKEKDIIVLHGGGNLGSIYPREGIYRRSYLLNHPNNRIIIMPQSVYYGTDKEAEEIKKKDIEAFKRARKLKLLCRDEMSFNTAKSIFTETTIALTPDVVTSLKEKFCQDNGQKRDGVLFILREDMEKVSDDATISEIKQWLDSNHVNHRSIDTVAKVLRMSKNDGEKHVQSILSAIKSSKLVVTDRFHGVIFSYITGTPVLAFKSFDTKITSGIKWFDDFEHIHYAENDNTEEIHDFINKYLHDAAIVSGSDFHDIFLREIC